MVLEAVCFVEVPVPRSAAGAEQHSWSKRSVMPSKHAMNAPPQGGGQGEGEALPLALFLISD